MDYVFQDKDEFKDFLGDNVHMTTPDRIVFMRGTDAGTDSTFEFGLVGDRIAKHTVKGDKAALTFKTALGKLGVKVVKGHIESKKK